MPFDVPQRVHIDSMVVKGRREEKHRENSHSLDFSRLLNLLHLVHFSTGTKIQRETCNQLRTTSKPPRPRSLPFTFSLLPGQATNRGKHSTRKVSSSYRCCALSPARSLNGLKKVHPLAASLADLLPWSMHPLDPPSLDPPSTMF